MKVLLVDDEASEIERLRQIVQDQGHEVLVASTGAEAVAVAEVQLPHVAVIDTELPDMSGLQVLRRIRLNPNTRPMAVLLTNPHPTDEEVIFGFQYFSDCHWERPVERSELVRFLNLVGPERVYRGPAARFRDDCWAEIWDAQAARE